MRNVKLTLQYDGTRYKGFQKQNQKGSNVVTIQGKLENVLSKMTGEEKMLVKDFIQDIMLNQKHTCIL